MTTSNQIFGEPVRYIRKIMPKGYGVARGIVINAGCSNVCTGPRGFYDAVMMAGRTARALSKPGDKPVTPEKFSSPPPALSAICCR